ncbi:MAG TPA: quinone-interacting membrane-bound oxidoreductase complex subunit QmoC [Terriglobia bacterium]|nr:quinone-interacting membrane-bound oxidoreductase complex subunit QmoC [Terriglobia bacterium]
MAEGLTIEPDLGFIDRLMKAGGSELKRCFQCGTCASVCSLADSSRSFPRQQMIKAQWGLKDEVLADPAIWLCHDCSDCTANCPRGAKPSAVMGALRMEAIKRYAFPRSAAKMVTSVAYLPIVLLLPALLFGAVAWRELGHAPARPYVFDELFPQSFLEPLFYAVAAWVVTAFAVGIARLVRDLRASGVVGRIMPGLLPSFKEIAAHERFKKCTEERKRYWGHFLTLFGFLGLAIVGTAVGAGTMAGVMHTPLPLLSVLKVFANVCAVVILAGTIILLLPTTPSQGQRTKKTYFDNFFLYTLAGVALTGVLSELFRLAQNAPLMYSVYFVHLILIFTLLFYSPYSKFAHFVYRTVVMAATQERKSRAGLQVAHAEY